MKNIYLGLRLIFSVSSCRLEKFFRAVVRGLIGLGDIEWKRIA